MTKKQKILLVTSVLVLICIVIFCIIYYHEIIGMLDRLLNKTDELKQFIEGLGFKGIAVIFICVILLFFFPVITSAPLQIALGLTYGLFKATFIIWIALTIAHQLAFLFSRNLRTFYSKKKRKEQAEIEAMIQSSSRGINAIMVIAYIVPFIPFIIISMVAISSGMRYRRYTLYTTLGTIPEIMATLLIGKALIATSPVASMIFVILLFIVVILCFIFKKRIIEWIFKGKKREEKQ